MSAAVHAPQPPSWAGPQPQPLDANTDARPTLLVTTVDIGGGQAGRIEVRLGDDPVDVARAFCARHGLPEAIVLPLAQHLEENLADSMAQAAGEAEHDGQPHGYMSGGEELYSEEEYEPSMSAGRYTPSPPPAAATLAGSRSASAEADAWPGAVGAQQRPASAAAAASAAGSFRSQQGARPATAGAASDASGRGAAQPQQPAQAAATQESTPLAYRPACTTSSHGAQYFNHGSPSTCPNSARSHASDSTFGGALHQRAGGGLPAHSRLYADHFRKQQRLEEERRLRDLEIQLKTEQVHIAPASCKLASHRTAGAYRNYGERLYVEGRLDAMRKEQMAQRLKEEEARAELEQYTFAPEISKLAQRIKASEAELGPGAASAYQRLYQRGSGGTAKRQERMAAIRREQDEAEVRECSFRPRINSKSSQMVAQRQQILKDNGLPGFEQLYNDSQRRRVKLEALAQRPPEEATFRPQVNTSSVVVKKLLEGREGEGLLGAGSTDVATRLIERGRKYQEKLAAAQQQQAEAPRDSATGQPLFRPKTHRAPHYERNPDGAPIGEYLHSIKAEWDERAARLRHAREARAQQDAASTYVNSKSERLVDRLKRERFRAIFNYLRRGDPAPVLNLLEAVQDDVFMDTIDPEVRADIEYAARLLAKAMARRQAADLQDCATSAPAPDTTRSAGSTAASSAASAFCQSTSGELDAAGFVTLMEEVVSRTKGLTRQYLLPMPSGRQKFEEPSFRPAIDPKSQVLAARLRPAALPAHEVLYKTAEEIAAKREEMRRAAEEAKLKECLFRPVMVAQPKAKEGRAIKLAQELIQSKRASEEEGYARQHQQQRQQQGQAPQAAASGLCEVDACSDGSGGAQGGQAEEMGLHLNAIERQINDAVMRLSLSEEQVAASLRQAHGAPAPAAQGAVQWQQPALAGMQVGQSVDAHGYRLDFHALLGTPSPDSMLPAPEPGDTGRASSMAGFNPLDEGDEGLGGVAWDDNSQEVVAHVLPTADAPSDAAAAAVAIEELVGLDLHALASSDLPEHAAEARTQAAGEQQPLSGESSRSGTAELYVTPREVLGSPAPSAT